MPSLHGSTADSVGIRYAWKDVFERLFTIYRDGQKSPDRQTPKGEVFISSNHRRTRESP